MSKTILIVEDNELNMKLFTDLLEAYGYGVLQAYTGSQGLAMARMHRPDLILMDVQLPEITGLDVTRMLKGDADTRGMPIVAVTAFAMKRDEELVWAAGCDDYLTKPIRVDTFLDAVRRNIERGEALPSCSALPVADCRSTECRSDVANASCS